MPFSYDLERFQSKISINKIESNMYLIASNITFNVKGAQITYHGGCNIISFPKICQNNRQVYVKAAGLKNYVSAALAILGSGQMSTSLHTEEKTPGRMQLINNVHRMADSWAAGYFN